MACSLNLLCVFQDNLIESESLPENSTPTPKVIGSINCSTGFQDEYSRQVPTSTLNSDGQNTNRLSCQGQQDPLPPCKKAKKGEAIEDNTTFLILKGGETSKVMETSAPVKIGFDICTPVINEEPRFHIKSLGEKHCSGVSLERMNMGSAGYTGKPSSSILLEDLLMTEKLGTESMLFHKPVSDSAKELSKENLENGGFLQTDDLSRFRGIWRPRQKKEELVPEHEHQNQVA